jgi:hypothetical protein
MTKRHTERERCRETSRLGMGNSRHIYERVVVVDTVKFSFTLKTMRMRDPLREKHIKISWAESSS